MIDEVSQIMSHRFHIHVILEIRLTRFFIPWEEETHKGTDAKESMAEASEKNLRRVRRER